MKTKNIAATFRNKQITLFERYNESGDTVIQYIGDGNSTYPITKLPPLSTESTLTLSHVLEKDCDNYIVQTMEIPEETNFEDTKANTERAKTAELEQYSFNRTCAGCGEIISEPWAKGKTGYRCGAFGPWQGYTVGIDRLLPYIPAWCPKTHSGKEGKRSQSGVVEEPK